MPELNFDSIQARQERQRLEYTFHLMLPVAPARDDVGNGRKQRTIIASNRNAALHVTDGFSRQAAHPNAQGVAKLEVAANSALRVRHADISNQDLLSCRRGRGSG